MYKLQDFDLVYISCSWTDAAVHACTDVVVVVFFFFFFLFLSSAYHLTTTTLQLEQYHKEIDHG